MIWEKVGNVGQQPQPLRPENPGYLLFLFSVFVFLTYCLWVMFLNPPYKIGNDRENLNLNVLKEVHSPASLDRIILKWHIHPYSDEKFYYQ